MIPDLDRDATRQVWQHLVDRGLVPSQLQCRGMTVRLHVAEPMTVTLEAYADQDFADFVAGQVVNYDFVLTNVSKVEKQG